MQKQIKDIQDAARRLDDFITGDDIMLDRALGEVEALIYSARQKISDEWRKAREPKPLLGSEDLEQILKDIDELKPISEVTDEQTS